MERGSVYRKWDLHVHTPASYEHQFSFSNSKEREKYGGDIWGKYIDELEKIRDVSVIGICDYFSLEGFKRVLEYRGKGRLSNFDLILPNIEFRLDRLVGSHRVNYHAIFSEELDADSIEREFLGQLIIQTHTGEPRNLNRKNIEHIGKILKEQDDSFVGKSEYVVGCENITVSLDEIIKVLNDRKTIFNGKYLLILAEPEWALMKWKGQDHLTKKRILCQSDALFSSSKKTREWALGQEYKSPTKFTEEFISLKPCIHGSDAHCFEKICKPDLNKYCWIKADPSFEGLKQIIYEPEDRIIISPQCPENRKNIYTLDSLQINKTVVNEDLTISSLNIGLNNNLVTIVGGKGTGKTAFLDLIANCFEDRCCRVREDHIDRNSFVQRIETQAPDLTVELNFIGEDVLPFSKKLVEEDFFKDVSITYLPQGKIEEYSGNRRKLDAKIEEVIFSSKDVVSSDFKQKFEEIERNIKELSNEITEINGNVFSLEQKTKNEFFEEIRDEIRLKTGKLSDNEVKIKQLTSDMEASATERIEELKGKETEARNRLGKIALINDSLTDLQSRLNAFQGDSNNTITDINRSLSELAINLNIPPLDFVPQLDSIQKVSKTIETLTKEVVDSIKGIEENITQLSGVEKQHVELLKENTQLKEDIKVLERQLRSLQKERDKIQSLSGKRLATYLQMLNKYLEWKNYYRNVIDTFSKGKSAIMSGVDFEPSIHFEKDRFELLGEDILHLRKVSRDELKELGELLERITTEDNKEKQTVLATNFANKILGYKEYLKATRNTHVFYSWAFGNYFALSTNKFFNRISMDKLSMGQKGTVLLKLFLAEGDYPLFIDQPEENLDNRFIYSELVPAFKQAKKNRQVIIATNNANLVVNADAEQIIVAEFSDNVISYRTGALENTDIRGDITTILEGGEEAFKIREKKYGIKHHRYETLP